MVYYFDNNAHSEELRGIFVAHEEKKDCALLMMLRVAMMWIMASLLWRWVYRGRGSERVDYA